MTSCIEKCDDNAFVLRMRIEYDLDNKTRFSVKTELEDLQCFSQEGNFSEYCFDEFPKDIIIEFNSMKQESFQIKSVLFETPTDQLFLDSNYLFHQHFIGNKKTKYIESEDQFEVQPNSTIQFISRPFLNNKLKQMQGN